MRLRSVARAASHEVEIGHHHAWLVRHRLVPEAERADQPASPELSASTIPAARSRRPCPHIDQESPSAHMPGAPAIEVAPDQQRIFPRSDGRDRRSSADWPSLAALTAMKATPVIAELAPAHRVGLAEAPPGRSGNCMRI